MQNKNVCMLSSEMSDVVALLDQARQITVLTGAGMSAPSGVPTFRGTNDLWENRRAEELATRNAFTADPHGVWAWYAWRRQRIAECEPNHGHQVLSKWSRLTTNFTVITQNVDGLHERAGTRNVIPFHGSIWSLKCLSNCQQQSETWSDNDTGRKNILPSCPHCGGIARSAVVWFGESIDAAVMQASINALHCDLFLLIGTSGLVQPAASFAKEAKSNGAFVVEINTEGTPLSVVADAVFEGSCDDILRQIDQSRTSEKARDLNTPSVAKR